MDGPDVGWYLIVAAILFGIGALVRVAPEGVDERIDGTGEADEDRKRRDQAGLPSCDARAGEQDRDEPGERGEQADPASDLHPASP